MRTLRADARVLPYQNRKEDSVSPVNVGNETSLYMHSPCQIIEKIVSKQIIRNDLKPNDDDTAKRIKSAIVPQVFPNPKNDLESNFGEILHHETLFVVLGTVFRRSEGTDFP